MLLSIQVLLLVATTLYQAIAVWRENQQLPPGQFVDLGGYRLHLYVMGQSSSQPTIVLDHSLGGMEGYLLVDQLAQFGQVCIYDRAGYGWSDPSPYPRTSQQVVTELDALLTQAGIQPPYLLIGNSFGSYNMRLYAHQFPEKTCGLVLTDGLHEAGMLTMPIQLRALQAFFASGFLMSVVGNWLGITRLLRLCGLFEWMKPELRQFPPDRVASITRSFCRPNHWWTMAREIVRLDRSGHEVSAAKTLGNLPIVTIKARSFFLPAFWTWAIPLQSANRLREQMHRHLLTLSSNTRQVEADRSGHFVWTDQPDVMVTAVATVLQIAQEGQMNTR